MGYTHKMKVFREDRELFIDYIFIFTAVFDKLDTCGISICGMVNPKGFHNFSTKQLRFKRGDIAFY